VPDRLPARRTPELKCALLRHTSIVDGKTSPALGLKGTTSSYPAT
jgi:hypothetical protein